MDTCGKLIAGGVDTSDQQCQQFSTTLIESLETTKSVKLFL
jgi:hypothetical protein